jgi:hypothetical protein
MPWGLAGGVSFAAQPAKIYGSGNYQAALTGEFNNTSNLLLDKAKYSDKIHNEYCPNSLNLEEARWLEKSF